VGETALKEAVDDGATEEVKPQRRLRLPWPRRQKPVEPPAAGADEDEAPVEVSPLAYTTFSSKLAPALTAIGAALSILGGLGAWVRATEVETEGLAAHQVAVQMGYNDPEGLTIAVFGALVLITAAFWVRRRPVLKVVPAFVLKLVPLLLSLAIIGLSAWQLPEVDASARSLAAEAVQDASFANFHAGLGWGAWCLISACVALFLGSAVGILRELDLRRAEKKRGAEG
jgi:hypothetical protein